MLFIYGKGQLIGDGDVKLTGVNGDENEVPLQIENENYLDFQEDQGEVHPKQEVKNIQQPAKVELKPLQEGPTKLVSFPECTSPHAVQEYIKQEGPDETSGVHKYSRVFFDKKIVYTHNERL